MNEKGKDDILLLSASVGAGHLRAAEAIEKVIGERLPGAAVRHEDALQYTTAFFRQLYSNIYVKAAHVLPDLHSYWFNRFDKPWAGQWWRRYFDGWNSLKLMRKLERERPGLIISTHFFPAQIVSMMRREGRLKCRHAIVVTDFDPHAWWFCHEYDRYFVVLEQAKVFMGRNGIDEDKVSVAGVPIDPAFGEERDQTEARRALGLAEDKRIILFSGGGCGLGHGEEIVAALKGLQMPCEVVAICGNNKKLKKELDGLAERMKGDGGMVLKPIGFTMQMNDYMAAADVMVGKPGGLTVWESMTRGLALVIVNPLRGQEERNSDHLLEAGAAVRCNDLELLGWKIERLLSDRERLETMQARARQYADAKAAERIVAGLPVDQD